MRNTRMAGPVSLLLRRERTVILAVLVGLSVLGWGLVIWQSVTMRAPSMGGSMSPQASLTVGMDAALFLAIWVAMMIAMMFPASAPMVLMFHAISAGKRQRAQTYVPTWVFLLGYLIVWSLAGVVPFAFASGRVPLASHSPWLMSNTSGIGGVVPSATGIYPLSPVKNSCLCKSHPPPRFTRRSLRQGYDGA